MKKGRAMTPETKHTPLPWSIHPLSNRKVCAGPDGCKHTIAGCGRAGEVPSNIYDELCANAAFIVRACNAHYGLVEACAGLLDFLERFPHQFPVDISGYEDSARAALAKAKGQP